MTFFPPFGGDCAGPVRARIPPPPKRITPNADNGKFYMGKAAGLSFPNSDCLIAGDEAASLFRAFRRGVIPIQIIGQGAVTIKKQPVKR
jgi:hypothetical protein